MSEYITRERALEILNDIGGCGAEGGMTYTEQEAADKWNRRADNDP